MWPGGKDGAGVVQRLINQVPPHDVFVSAFLGDCALLRKMAPSPRSIGIDLDTQALLRWASDADSGDGRSPAASCGGQSLRGARLQDGAPKAASSAEDAGTGGGGRVELYRCDCIEWLRFQFGWYRVAGSSGGGSGGGRSTAAANGDATRSTWFVYADPPYLLSTRKTSRPMYAHEMTEADHVRLLDTLVWLPCLVMVSHYPCGLYDDALADWRSFEFRTMTRGGRMATEKVWCNYPVPERLHDSRFLGRDKRERERIRRRVRRALGKVQRLPALERQAVLDALLDGQGYLGVGAGSRPR